MVWPGSPFVTSLLDNWPGCHSTWQSSFHLAIIPLGSHVVYMLMTWIEGKNTTGEHHMCKSIFILGWQSMPPRRRGSKNIADAAITVCIKHSRPFFGPVASHASATKANH